MSDITMCDNWDCEKRESCYRYIAEPGYYQSYFMFLDDESKKVFADNCRYYWCVDGYK